MFFASLLAFAAFIFLFFFILIGIGVSAMMSGKGDEQETIASKSVLELDFDSPVVELVSDKEDEFGDFGSFNFGAFGQQQGVGLINTINAIDAAADNKNIEGIYMPLSFVSASGSQIREIRQALDRFKAKKKWVVASGSVLNQSAYYLASAADKIFIMPEGGISFNGASATIPYLKGTLDKLEVKPEIFRVGAYKSAVEPFMLYEMSKENREQYSALLNGRLNTMIADIAVARKIDPIKLRVVSDSMKAIFPEEFKELGLITDLAYRDEVQAYIRKKLGLKKEDAKIKYVSVSEVNNSTTKSSNTNKIAVIVAEGDISDDFSGGNDEGITPSDLIADIRKAKKDKSVKAVVLRINSPGGSALASEEIYREIQLLRKVKPVVASQSSMAASGGYYLSMGCNTIMAQPNTVTGSIGVFGLMFNAEGLIKNKLGVNPQVVKTGAYSDIMDPSRAVTPAERAIIQRGVDRIYERFTSEAAACRKMPVEQLREVAQGRVWTGETALSIGLVDKLGGYKESLAEAAKLGKIKGNDYQVVFIPEPKSFFDELIDFGKKKKDVWVAEQTKEMLGEHYTLWQTWNSIKSRQGVQAWLPVKFD